MIVWVKLPERIAIYLLATAFSTRGNASKLTCNGAQQSEPIASLYGLSIPGVPMIPRHSWQLLRVGVDATREVPSERWDTDADNITYLENPQTICTRRGAFLVLEVESVWCEFLPFPALKLWYGPAADGCYWVSWRSSGKHRIAPNKLMVVAAGCL
jgi:hypothetical protein